MAKSSKSARRARTPQQPQPASASEWKLQIDDLLTVYRPDSFRGEYTAFMQRLEKLDPVNASRLYLLGILSAFTYLAAPESIARLLRTIKTAGLPAEGGAK